MMLISRWAKRNVAMARLMLIAGKTIVFVMAIYLGWLVAQSGFLLPDSILFAVAVTTLIIILLYPVKQSQQKNNYYQRKCCDFLIGLAGFISIAYMSNRMQNPAYFPAALYASSVAHITPAQKILLSLENNKHKTLTLKEKKILRREFGRQLKTYTKAILENDEKTKNKAGLIILVIVAAVGLTFLLAMLACSISCNGAEFAAILVMVLGLGALIWGTIALINRIKRGRPKTEKEIK